MLDLQVLRANQILEFLQYVTLFSSGNLEIMLNDSLSERIEFAVAFVQEFRGVSTINFWKNKHINRFAGSDWLVFPAGSREDCEVNINAKEVNTPIPVIFCSNPRKSSVSSLLWLHKLISKMHKTPILRPSSSCQVYREAFTLVFVVLRLCVSELHNRNDVRNVLQDLTHNFAVEIDD